MEIFFKLLAASCITLIIGWLFAVAIDRIKHRLTQPDD